MYIYLTWSKNIIQVILEKYDSQKLLSQSEDIFTLVQLFVCLFEWSYCPTREFFTHWRRHHCL